MSAPAPAGCPTAPILVRLTSIVEPLTVGSLFERPAPLEVELGSGDGGWLMAYARLHPERNFLGVERLLGRIRKLERKAPRLGLTNLRGLRIEAAYLLRYLLPAGSARALHVYFPDPWPKKRHHARRLVNAEFPELAARVLAADGRVFLRTDDANYFMQMQEVFGASAAFTPAETSDELAGVLTDFETAFAAEGKPTLRSAWSLVPPEPEESVVRSPSGAG
jgi:tRNA (guanine-N7-)-methyltransferase